MVPSQGERAVKAFHLVVKLKSPDEKDREKEVLDNKGSPPPSSCWSTEAC